MHILRLHRSFDDFLQQRLTDVLVNRDIWEQSRNVFKCGVQESRGETFQGYSATWNNGYHQGAPELDVEALVGSFSY